MSKTKRLCFVSCVLVLFAGVAPAALAQQPTFLRGVEIGEAAYGGSGCLHDRGGVRAELSPDGRWLLVDFDEYVARTAAGSGFVRKSCNLAIPVSVPRGLRVSLSWFWAYGHASIPSGGHGTFRTEYFFSGSTGPMVRRDLAGGFEGEFAAIGEAAVASACGEDVIVRLSTSARAASPLGSTRGASVGVRYLAIQLAAEPCRAP